MIDFLIIGTPKAGTTALQSYLSECSGIFMPKAKELHFFGDEFKDAAKNNVYYSELNLIEYHDLFKNAKPKDIKGEASVFYLYSKSACKQIKEYNPNMKIIACFRNPVDFLISYHQDSLYIENEDERDFWTALKLEEKRKNGDSIPAHNTLRMALYYKEMVNYSKYLENYINEFGKKNIHIIIFENFFLDTEKHFSELLDFLGHKSFIKHEFKKVNPRRNIKNESLNKLIRRPGRLLRRILRILLPNQKIRLLIYNFLRKSNSSHERINDLKLSDKHKLYKMFQINIADFEKLINKDLIFWKKYSS